MVTGRALGALVFPSFSLSPSLSRSLSLCGFCSAKIAVTDFGTAGQNERVHLCVFISADYNFEGKLQLSDPPSHVGCNQTVCGSVSEQ